MNGLSFYMKKPVDERAVYFTDEFSTSKMMEQKTSVHNYRMPFILL